MKQIPASLLTLIAGIGITLISFWVGQHHNLLPEQASEQAPLVDNFFNVMVTIGTGLFLVVEGAIVLFIIQFRQRKGDESDGVPIEGSFSLEVLWTSIPAIIVVGLGVYSVVVYEQMGGFSLSAHGGMAHGHASVLVAQAPGDAAVTPLISETTTPTEPTPTDAPQYGIGATPLEGSQAADLVVNVTGLQYAWIFNYPNSGITAGELHVPVGKDVQLIISAQDVIHSFWVPQFRLKQDAIPGQTTELRFVATKPGTYPVVCTELCGGYHGSMRSEVVVHSPEEFDVWLHENQIAQASGVAQTVAVNPVDLTPSEFLAPYADALGIQSEAIASLHSHHS
ncbi:cytochrome c oxidase subunit II [Oscillatoria sp. FACHB-1407]|uniref:cytochrome c oxidase subunit II n=1 Tax=Oscillatoria sp. FACHB-1407 TaxID=2692847 RepID=UPI00168968BE|nr:cytochrome c oxidase subunit II [Oscillatoria sp. FACHB-1407]MBD2459878.1 cytochrome c oxidase subunit II [Oscillatoria sp. FACHB-1407]